MKKLLLICCLAVLLVACQDNEGTQSSTDNPFLGGTTGLRLEFSPGAPPSEVFDEGEFPFDIEVEIENVGETEVEANDISVKIDGINADEFGSSDLVIEGIDDDLRGAEKDSTTGQRVNGDIRYVVFEDLEYQPKIVGASRTRPIIATACYEYATQAVAEVCILEDVTEDDSEVCTVEGTKSVHSSGAPVQVTGFRQSRAGTDKIEFQFDVQDQGTAKIYESESECEDERSLEEVVHVSVETELSGLRCAGLRDGSDTEGYITLREGSFTVRCTQEVDAESDFERTVSIELEYAVEDSVKTDLLIKSSE